MKGFKKLLLVSSLAFATAVSSVNPLTALASGMQLPEAVNAPADDSNTEVWSQAVPSRFTVTANMLGGDLIVDIPDSIVLTDDGDLLMEASRSIGVSGALHPAKTLRVALLPTLDFRHVDNSSQRFAVQGDITLHKGTGTPAKSEVTLYSADLFTYADGSWTATDKSGSPLTTEAYVASWTAEDVFNKETAEVNASAEKADFKFVGSYEATVTFYVSTPNK